MATTLTEEQIKDVLTRVRNQAGFRDALTQNPAAALAGIGISTDGEDIPPTGVTLPTDAAIQSRLDELTQEVLGKRGVIRQLLQLEPD